MSKHILLIEDDNELAALLASYLADAGFDVESRSDARGGLELLGRGSFDALILDVMLPDMDGFDVCRRVRATSEIPILMLTARGETTDRIVGLELGADDYLPKPFNPRELLARLRAVLRRRSPESKETGILCFGRLEIDRGARLVRRDGETLPLTSYQFDLLWELASNAGRVLSRDRLMERVKNAPLEAFNRSIDVHVSRIRAVIEDDPGRPRRILTVRGVGYVFAKRQDGDQAS